jgi:hypothetical protein
MRYVCLIYFDPKKVFDGSAEANAVLAAVGPHDEALKAKGQLADAARRGDDGASAGRQDVGDGRSVH